MGPIILCDDGSEIAAEAIRTASALLGTDRKALSLHIWTSPSTMVLPDAGIGMSWVPPELEDQAKKAASELAAQAAGRAREAGFDAEPLAVEGRGAIWHTILDVAREHDASLIVCGARGLTGIKHTLLGSVSEKVARHADRPVLVVHPK